jgi:class 3 adenylate cyclase/dihydrofolate reductase
MSPVKLVVTAFVTVDGVIEGPGFDEHRDGKNAWALRVQNEEDGWFNRNHVFSADAFLLGRKTYQIWAAFWPTATGDEELAKRMNEIPKYVVSNTLTRADWANSTIISGDVVSQIADLKERSGGDLMVYGSPDLVDTLLVNDLIDEFRLLFYPVILGSGKHMFRDGIETHHLRLVDSRTFSSGVVLLTYRPESEAPTSRFVEDYSWTQEQVRSLQAAQDVDRVLATVLFTDLVDSTRQAAAYGDRAWRQLLDRHDHASRTEVERWIGHYVKSTGDGMLATFDAPTRALRCAFELREAVARMGLRVRAAIHTGEVERRHDDVGGIGVHIAARALGAAGPEQVVVTRTVRDLATGTDLQFAPLGTVSLRGVPGQWELFEASLS